jgi:hypothetical protein
VKPETSRGFLADRSATGTGPDELAFLVDVAACPAYLDLGEAAREVEGVVELRVDDDLAVHVDVAPALAHLDPRQALA